MEVLRGVSQIHKSSWPMKGNCFHGNLRYPPQCQPPAPNKALYLGGVALGGIPYIPMTFDWWAEVIKSRIEAQDGKTKEYTGVVGSLIFLWGKFIRSSDHFLWRNVQLMTRKLEGVSNLYVVGHLGPPTVP